MLPPGSIFRDLLHRGTHILLHNGQLNTSRADAGMFSTPRLLMPMGLEKVILGIKALMHLHQGDTHVSLELPAT